MTRWLAKKVRAGERLKVTGIWTIQEHDAEGRLVSEEVVENLVTASGRGLLWDIILGVQPTLAAVAAGTSSTAVTDGQTALVAEVVRFQLTSMTRAGSVLTVRLFMGTAQGNGNTYREAGIFNTVAANSGVMLNRITHADKVKDTSKTLTYLITITLSSS